MNSIPDAIISEFGEFVARRIGLHFPRERWSDLTRGACAAAQEFRFDDPATFLQWLVSTPITTNQIEILASHLTVGETYFFRDAKQFEFLEQFVFPALIRSRRDAGRSLRIWSAGCSSGEEAYSIAILLAKLIPDIPDWHITILATDINPRSLRKASEGTYTDWSFRDTPLWVKENYFKRSKQGRFELLPEIKKMVAIRCLNLGEDAYPSLFNNTNAMDVIICRNVLMYFTSERMKNVVDHFYRSLVDGSWLIVSACEASQTLFSEFVTVNSQGATFYRKGASGVEAATIVTTVREEQTVFPVAMDDIGKSDEEGEASSAIPHTVSLEEAAAFYACGQYTEAAETIIALFADGDTEPKTMALLARIYANQGRLAEAMEWCQKAITADRLNPSFYYLRATILEEQSQHEEAETCLKQVLYLDQDFVPAHFALGNLTLRKGKTSESRRHFQNTLKLLGDFPPEQVLPEAEGITAGRLREIIHTMELVT
jgi:chemotaxis protein methyltransferase CheR